MLVCVVIDKETDREWYNISKLSDGKNVIIIVYNSTDIQTSDSFSAFESSNTAAFWVLWG